MNHAPVAVEKNTKNAVAKKIKKVKLNLTNTKFML